MPIGKRRRGVTNEVVAMKEQETNVDEEQETTYIM